MQAAILIDERVIEPLVAAGAITNAVEMAKHSGMTDGEAYQHVANILPETPTAVVVEWVRKEVRKRAREHSCASELQLVCAS